jgi:hypothetical protein
MRPWIPYYSRYFIPHIYSQNSSAFLGKPVGDGDITVTVEMVEGVEISLVGPSLSKKDMFAIAREGIFYYDVRSNLWSGLHYATRTVFSHMNEDAN